LRAFNNPVNLVALPIALYIGLQGYTSPLQGFIGSTNTNASVGGKTSYKGLQGV